ncbi:hypothetical protein ACHAPE_009332 [Trichoderma viride]
MGGAELDQIAGIHWQVAQATSINNINIIMTDKGTSTQGAENGSGGWLSDITFYGGWYGFLGGNQQYTVSELTFYNCTNGVGLIWDWGWIWPRMTFQGYDIAMYLDPPGASQSDSAGSMYLLDSQFIDCGAVINTFSLGSSEAGTTVFTFDNLYFSSNTIPLHKGLEGTPSSWSATTISSADCAIQSDGTWIDAELMLCGLVVAVVGNETLVTEWQEMLAANGNTNTTVSMDSDDNVDCDRDLHQVCQYVPPKVQGERGYRSPDYTAVTDK